MKICTICKASKELGDFNKNKRRKDGLNNICRVCSNARSGKYYEEKTKLHRENVAKRKKTILTFNKQRLLSLLKTATCADCGNTDHRTFEFDHVSGEKFANVSSLIAAAYMWNTIEDEIAKCEIVCANCHRIRSYTRAGSYRLN